MLLVFLKETANFGVNFFICKFPKKLNLRGVRLRSTPFDLTSHKEGTLTLPSQLPMDPLMVVGSSPHPLTINVFGTFPLPSFSLILYKLYCFHSFCFNTICLQFHHVIHLHCYFELQQGKLGSIRISELS